MLLTKQIHFHIQNAPKSNVNPIVTSILTFNCRNFLASAIPQRANEPWSVILCKFADTARYEPRTREWYQKWMTGSGTDTIAKYFMDVSNGLYTIENTKFFVKASELCVKFATRMTRLNEKKITILNAKHGAMYDKKSGVLITPPLSFNSVMAHEMVHSFHIGHSYSDRQIRIFPFAHMGEYDDHYDLMSTANAWMYMSQYGPSGPGLSGPHLDYLGWLPSNRILYFGRDGKKSSIIRLSSLSIPHRWSSDWLLVMVPFNRDDPANVFTLEFRTPVNYDSGLAQEAVIIHKIDRKGINYYSTIVTHCHDYDEMMAGTEWVHFLEQDSSKIYQAIKIRVERIDKQRKIAIVHINSTFNPMSCKGTEELRYLRNDTDKVEFICIPNGTFVEESLKNLRRKQQRFFKDLTTFGMNACHDGYVWRMIDPYDYICVTKKRKQQIQNQKDVRNRFGACRKPLVLRRAFPGDNGCVTQEEFIITQEENAKSHENMKYHSFFNGEETIMPQSKVS
uniref:Uncharacterized protein n=1 Tax=Setaria digitata TaxID=48799 RepID=A0A915PH35_9BILA